MGEPLKGKRIMHHFEFDDIKSAVEWLKEQLDKHISLDHTTVKDYIDQAFPDLKPKEAKG